MSGLTLARLTMVLVLVSIGNALPHDLLLSEHLLWRVVFLEVGKVPTLGGLVESLGGRFRM